MLSEHAHVPPVCSAVRIESSYIVFRAHLPAVGTSALCYQGDPRPESADTFQRHADHPYVILFYSSPLLFFSLFLS